MGPRPRRLPPDQRRAGGGGGEPVRGSGQRRLRLVDGRAHLDHRGREVQGGQPRRRRDRGRSGTGDGFQLFCNGETDISDASRPISEEEVAACEDAGIEFTELAVGIDGLTVATNPNNADVECLDVPALYALVGPESEGIDNWSGANELAAEVGSARHEPPRRRPGDLRTGEESGTYDSFVEFAIADLAEERAGRVHLLTTTPAPTTTGSSRASRGRTRRSVAGLRLLRGGEGSMKAIAIDTGDGCVAPSRRDDR